MAKLPARPSSPWNIRTQISPSCGPHDFAARGDQEKAPLEKAARRLPEIHNR